jgi:hypothetical protein
MKCVTLEIKRTEVAKESIGQEELTSKKSFSAKLKAARVNTHQK